MNNRQIATTIWVLLTLVWGASRPDIRRSFLAVLRALVAPKLLGALLALSAWIAGLLWLASGVGLWKSQLVGDAVTWWLATGLVMFGAALTMFEDRRAFGRFARQALHLTVCVEVFVNLYVFPLAVELVLVPVVALLSMMSVIARSHGDLTPARKLTDSLLSLVGLGLIVYVGAKLATDFSAVAGDGLRALVLPVWLTVGVAPFMVGLGFVSHLEQRALRRSFAS